MRVLWLSPSDMLTEWMHGSLACLGEHEISICYYDKLSIPVDRPMLDAADCIHPDVILYISQAGGPYCASPSTFARLRKKAPTVHLCFDAGDIGWTPYLETYRAQQCFDLTVACDGVSLGPVDLISFHPVDPRPYQNLRPLAERPMTLGTCGSFAYGLRKDVMDHLARTSGLVLRPREDVYGSYQRYADFYKDCKIVVDCALSAGGPDGKGPYTKTLKTRAIEVGLAGAVLLDLRGCALERWATPGVDYVAYETPEEAEAVVRDLLANPDYMQDLADNLASVVRTKMSPAVFWAEVFTRLERSRD